QDCPFHAPRYYVDALRDVTGHPVSVLGDDLSPSGRLAALRRGPYGRCVYRCDNDVADHQQTLLTFGSGLTATLTASAFTGENTRHLAITGTRGQLHGHMDSGELRIDLYTPGAGLELPVDLPVELVDAGADGPLRHPTFTLAARAETVAADHRGHGGGDDGLMDAFCRAVEDGTVGSGELSFATALDSHLVAFAAEESREGGGVVDLAAWARGVGAACARRPGPTPCREGRRAGASLPPGSSGHRSPPRGRAAAAPRRTMPRAAAPRSGRPTRWRRRSRWPGTCAPGSVPA